MTSIPPARPFEVRHVQLARAAFAAIAALMITFSPDHSADVGLSVFSGFAIATGLVLLLAAWLVYGAGERWPAVLMGSLSIVAGMVGGIVVIRSVPLFFAVVIAWAVTTGIVETIAGARKLRQARATGGTDAARGDARDALTVGIITLVLGAVLPFISTRYVLEYSITDVDQTFLLTGIIIAVGVFGAYAAVIAVYLAIAGFSPRRTQTHTPPHATAPHEQADAAPNEVATGERATGESSIP